MEDCVMNMNKEEITEEDNKERSGEKSNEKN